LVGEKSPLHSLTPKKGEQKAHTCAIPSNNDALLGSDAGDFRLSLTISQEVCDSSFSGKFRKSPSVKDCH
jgi:hypothetical protein